jgi:hypothetical protein
MNDKPTFICKDCHSPVYDALGIVRDRCLTCQWVSDIKDKRAQKKLRDFLKGK